MMANKLLRLAPDDDVAIALAELAPNATAAAGDGSSVTALSGIPRGHKVALRDLAAGTLVHKYGHVIGVTSTAVRAGAHVHVHNLTMPEGASGLASGGGGAPTRPDLPADLRRTFLGIPRADGRVGTRNYVAVISTVNCSASVCQFIRERFRDVQRDFPHVDGVIAITHKSGCGTKLFGEDHEALMRVLGGYARHPNVAAYVLIGLGCEVNQTVPLIERQSLGRPRVLSIQEAGGVRRTVEAGARAVLELLPAANEARRTRQPVSELILATNCGGSDGNSGITANPALGWAVDELVRYGGTGVLAETSEIYGAEHLLIRRAVSEGVAKKLIDRFKWWEHYCRVLGAEMDNNPAPGNKAGGLTTVFEKSLGGVTKGGTTPLNDVFLYAEPITTRGFVFMDTPGHDPVSVTGLVAGGANIVVFTTGRGSVFGCKPVPSIKLATNSLVYRQMEADMDINCGVILEGAPLETVGRQIFEEVVAVASGKRTKSEAEGIGEEEFAPWIIGPVL